MDDAARALVAGSADPQGVTAALERFFEAGGRLPATDEGRALLAAILASGSFLPDLLLADVEQIASLEAHPYLRRAKSRELVAAEVRTAVETATDTTALKRALRLLRRREMLRLGARELGWGTTLEVARELSYFADACLDAAVRVCDAELRAAYGQPAGPDGEPSFTVLAMGKLGGEELNFCSDVDLIYLYSTDEGRAGTLTLHEYYARLSQMVTAALADVTDEGLVFRVDLRLRPEGRSGAICNSLAAAESYYETFGRTWERQALLRARPAAGDLALGERCLRRLEPFVYPRSLGPEALDEARRLRKLYEPGADRGGFNVKLGAGGIRDIELVAQVLQLFWAGKRHELRERGTLPALHRLALAGLLSDQEVRALGAAYRFWRRLEHRVQLEHGAQTHSLPDDAEGFARLTRRLGMESPAALAGEIERRRQAVSAIANTLGEPEQGPSALVLRLLDPASPRERLEEDLRAAGFVAVEASADSLDLARGRLPPAWLEEAIASPDPDRALGMFRDLALHGSLGLFALLREQPTLVRMLAGLFGTSERLSRYLITHPALWEPLLEGLGLPRPAPTSWMTTLPARLAGLDEESALREMRRYQAQEIVRIGLHDVAGNLAPEEVSFQLGALAEACLREAVKRVSATLEERYGSPTAALTILALGSFGSREMRYGSDLDLVFLYERAGVTDRGMDHQEWFARLAQRLIGALGALLEEGRLYDVDTRLRPSGEQGLLVTTYAGFDSYHQDEAAPWERAALLRARPVYSSGDEAAFARLLEQAAYERTVDEEALRAELARVRRRIEEERAGAGRGSLHLRFSPGGLTDLEFLSAWGQLRHGGHDRALRTTQPLAALIRLAERGELDPALLDDYRFLQRASLRLRLLRDRPDDRLVPEDLQHLARSLELGTDELAEALRARMARVRAAFAAALGAPAG